MKLLFLSLGNYYTLSVEGIYTDLLRCFINNGHEVYVISPIERRNKEDSCVIREKNTQIVKVKIWNMQKTNVVEKGISMITIDKIFIKAIKKHFANIKFDLVLYPTPPITLVNVVEYVKNRDGAKTYLLLKDIFPQNAVDIGMMSTTGVKSIIYNYFRKKEKKLYFISDQIGCMSQANVDYVLTHNPDINSEKVEVCPNSIEVKDKSIEEQAKIAIRRKYNIPLDKKVFIYGGNLGKPQGIPFLISCLNYCKDIEDVYFLIIGNGTEYGLIEQYTINSKQKNLSLIKGLPKADYDTLVAACDVGMIFLDHRFTIPNFPSRLLGYLQAKLPVLACTDPNTDIGKVIEEGNFGWWCESNSVDIFSSTIMQIMESNITSLGEKAFQYLTDYYSVNIAYCIIKKSIE